MHQFEFTYLLNKPDGINPSQVSDLEKILNDYPYFQSAQSIYLKGLYLQESLKYNQTLKKTAALTTDRSVLFDFITSDDFIGIQKGYYDEKLAEIYNIQVVDSQIIEVAKKTPKEEIEVNTPNFNALENSILYSIKVASPEIVSYENKEKSTEIIEEKLEIGKPITFNRLETHSFQEWLQLSRLQPIERDENTKSVESKEEENESNVAPTLESKMDLIDKFIENNPKIPPANKEVAPPVYTQKTEDTSYLMTETLARVYLEQKKYNKAIQAYEILILKYPEKSSLFADRILDIKEFQQNNNK